MMKKQRHILCVGCLYIILKVNVFPNTGWMEASKGMQGMSFSTFGYADAPGYTFSRIGHTLIFLLGKTTGTRKGHVQLFPIVRIMYIMLNYIFVQITPRH